jgi:flavodoxin/Pyruvate/2-oxoacid:ferredoxin oxidoreductase delta subunit
MKILLLYFTGTGGTARLSDEIALNLRNIGNDVHQFRLEKADFSIIPNYDIVGIGSPTYAYRAPRIVTSLLKKFPKMNKPYFIFVTSGGEDANCAWNIYKVMQKKGWTFLDWINIVGPTNLRSWMPKLGRSPISHGLYNEDLEKCKEFVEKILAIYHKVYVNKEGIPKQLHPILGYSMLTWFLSANWAMAIATVGIKHVDPDVCTKCGLCATRICPSGCIQIGEISKLPNFKQSKCVGCNGCVNLCPTSAIYSTITKCHNQYTIYRDYVFHPRQ